MDFTSDTMTGATLLSALKSGNGIDFDDTDPDFSVTTQDGNSFDVDLTVGVTTVQELIDAIETAGAGSVSVAINEAVNLAKRLQEYATPNQILLGAATFDLVKDSIVARELEPVQVKGRAAVERIFELIDLKDA